MISMEKDYFCRKWKERMLRGIHRKSAHLTLIEGGEICFTGTLALILNNLYGKTLLWPQMEGENVARHSPEECAPHPYRKGGNLLHWYSIYK
jgi:hypothetical protein